MHKEIKLDSLEVVRFHDSPAGLEMNCLGHS